MAKLPKNPQPSIICNVYTVPTIIAAAKASKAAAAAALIAKNESTPIQVPTTFAGDLVITTAAGLMFAENYVSVTGNLIIRFPSFRWPLVNLPRMITVGGQIDLQVANATPTTITNVLPNLTTAGSIRIQNIGSTIVVSNSFTNLKTVNNSLQLKNGVFVTNSFLNLLFVGALEILNTGLVDLDFLLSLASIGPMTNGVPEHGPLYIDSNLSLTDISGLLNVIGYTLNTDGGPVTIINNTSLPSVTQVQVLIDQLVSTGYSGEFVTGEEEEENPLSFEDEGGVITVPEATEGEAFSFTITVSGGSGLTYVNTGASLPTGMTLNSATGVISGTPTVPGTYSGIIIQVTDNLGNVITSQPFAITVEEAVVLDINPFVGDVYILDQDSLDAFQDENYTSISGYLYIEVDQTVLDNLRLNTVLSVGGGIQITNPSTDCSFSNSFQNLTEVTGDLNIYSNGGVQFGLSFVNSFTSLTEVTGNFSARCVADITSSFTSLSIVGGSFVVYDGGTAALTTLPFPLTSVGNVYNESEAIVITRNRYLTDISAMEEILGTNVNGNVRIDDCTSLSESSVVQPFYTNLLSTGFVSDFYSKWNGYPNTYVPNVTITTNAQLITLKAEWLSGGFTRFGNRFWIEGAVSEPLSGMSITAIRDFILNTTVMTTISSLSTATEIGELSIFNTPLTNLNVLSSLVYTEYINIDTNAITNISGLLNIADGAPIYFIQIARNTGLSLSGQIQPFVNTMTARGFTDTFVEFGNAA